MLDIRFLESLGKRNKKMVLDWKTVASKGFKIAAHKKSFFSSSANFALQAGFFWCQCYYPHWSRDSLSPVCGILKPRLGQLLTIFFLTGVQPTTKQFFWFLKQFLNQFLLGQVRSFPNGWCRRSNRRGGKSPCLDRASHGIVLVSVGGCLIIWVGMSKQLERVSKC